MNRRYHTERKHWFLMIFTLLGVSLAACGGGSESSPVPGPAAPSNLQATPASSTNINLTWNDASNNEDGFRVYRGATSTTVTTLVATVGPGITSYPDTGLSASTTYFYKVTAFNTAGESALSNGANATTNPPPLTAPAAPTNLQAAAASSSGIILTWNDASNNEDGFRMYRGTTPTTVTTLVVTLGVGATSYSDTGLAASTTYYYKVTAFNSVGESPVSNVANATTNPPPLTAPAVPTNLQATAASSSVINLTWNDASNNEVGFRVYRGTTPTTVTTLVATLGVGATSYQNTGLAAGTNYYYAVTAFNSAGESALSNVATATTVSIPAAPTNLQAAAASSSAINLAWTDASNNEDGFRVYRGTTSTTVTDCVATLSAGTTSYSDTGLAASTTYYYKVTAFNSAGESAPSNLANATTNPPPLTTPAAPTNLQAAAASSSAINLAWTDASNNENGFRVYRGAGASPASFSKIGNDLGADTTTYTDITASAGITYVYRVSAFNTAGESSPAESAAVTTPMPSLVPTSVDAGNRHSLALMSNGTVRAWGSNTEGALGLGASIVSSLIPIPIGGLTGVSAISAGDGYSLALMNDVTMKGWGENSYGEVGTGNNVTPQYTATNVVGLTGVKAISAGGFQSIALKNDGTVWAWGSGQYGQIGDGSTTDRFTPVQVSGLTNVLAISAGENHTLALKSDGTVWAWGLNNLGQLGDGSTTNRSTPVQVSGLTNVLAISAGEFHSLALLNDGTVRGWGDNPFGEVGDGTSGNQRLTPVQVSGLTNVLAISAGGHFSVALKSDGTVWAWGSGQNGQIGDGGSPTNRSTPVQVKGPGGVGFLDNVLAISASQDHTLALKYNGTVATVWAWGYNGFGQIGDDTTIDALTPVPADGF